MYSCLRTHTCVTHTCVVGRFVCVCVCARKYDIARKKRGGCGAIEREQESEYVKERRAWRQGEGAGEKENAGKECASGTRTC